MGLDNYIVLKIKNQGLKERLTAISKSKIFEDEFDLLYWRKCYNIRGVIFSLIESEEDESTGRYKVTLSELHDIINQLEICYTPEWWSYNDDTIWPEYYDRDLEVSFDDDGNITKVVIDVDDFNNNREKYLFLLDNIQDPPLSPSMRNFKAELKQAQEIIEMLLDNYEYTDDYEIEFIDSY